LETPPDPFIIDAIKMNITIPTHLVIVSTVFLTLDGRSSEESQRDVTLIHDVMGTVKTDH
jgi:hypothetical protein